MYDLCKCKCSVQNFEEICSELTEKSTKSMAPDNCVIDYSVRRQYNNPDITCNTLVYKLNPKSADLFLSKLGEPKVFLNLKSS